jgi:hypothetical protein
VGQSRKTNQAPPGAKESQATWTEISIQLSLDKTFLPEENQSREA